MEAQGLFGAPPVKVVIGEEAHGSLLKALSLLGFGRERVARVPTDENGCIRVDLIPELDQNTIFRLIKTFLLKLLLLLPNMPR